MVLSLLLYIYPCSLSIKIVIENGYAQYIFLCIHRVFLLTENHVLLARSIHRLRHLLRPLPHESVDIYESRGLRTIQFDKTAILENTVEIKNLKTIFFQMCKCARKIRSIKELSQELHIVRCSLITFRNFVQIQLISVCMTV